MTRVELLEYAREGAQTRLGVLLGPLDDDEVEQLEKDIAAIERKLETAKYRELAKRYPAAAAWPTSTDKRTK